MSKLKAVKRTLVGAALPVIEFFLRLAGRRFARERMVVRIGRRRYHDARRCGATHSARLRRAVHRLEKGLIMKPRAATFAADYIGEAVESLSAVVECSSHDGAEINWAFDVMDTYFSVVSDSQKISDARKKFWTLRESVSWEIKTPRAVPYRRSEGVQADIKIEDFFSLCRKRRSIRWFLSKPIPRDLIETAIQVALQAPSACNRQPFFFRYFENSVDATRVASIAMGTTGYAHQIPGLLVLIGDWSCFEDERDRHLPYIDGSLAAMQLMLALETLGLGSCPINWPDVESLERRMSSELKLPRYMRPIMLIAVGYPDPDGGVAFSAKKSAEHVLQRGG